MEKKVLIVGAGPGGCMTANRLAKSMKKEIKGGAVTITLLSNVSLHVYEAGFLFMALDLKKPEQFTRQQRDVVDPLVDLVVDAAARIDVAKGKVLGVSGREYGYDMLVVATGSEVRPDITPGLKEGGDNFYTLEGTARLRDKLIDFREGRIVCAVEMPHKCPVGFVEILFMLHSYYLAKGIRNNIELSYTYPLDVLHQKPQVGAFCKPLMDLAGIGYITGFVIERVEPGVKKVFAKGGKEVDYDLLISTPTHRAPRVITESGLGDAQGWIDTAPKTLKMKGVENAYVIGDATNLHLIGVAKAGSAAHYQSEVIAGNIEQELHGLKPNRFYDGKVFCFVETSLNEATCIQFDYTTPPSPPPPSTLLHWFKLAFNEMYWASVQGIL